MKKLAWCLFFLFTYLGTEACTIIPRTFCNSINLLPNHAILTGVITDVDTTGINLSIVEVLRGEEVRANVRIWDGTDFDCNGPWSLAAANIGELGDSVVVVVPLITDIQNDWDVIGDYRWEDPYFYTPNLTIREGNAEGFILGIPGAPPEVNTFSIPYHELEISLLEEGNCSMLINSTTEAPSTSGIRFNNPVANTLSLQLAPGVDYEYLRIYSAHGQLLHQEQLTAQLVRGIELSDFPAGVYVLEIRYGGTQRELHKVVKM